MFVCAQVHALVEAVMEATAEEPSRRQAFVDQAVASLTLRQTLPGREGVAAGTAHRARLSTSAVQPHPVHCSVPSWKEQCVRLSSAAATLLSCAADNGPVAAGRTDSHWRCTAIPATGPCWHELVLGASALTDAAGGGEQQVYAIALPMETPVSRHAAVNAAVNALANATSQRVAVVGVNSTLVTAGPVVQPGGVDPAPYFPELDKINSAATSYSVVAVAAACDDDARTVAEANERRQLAVAVLLRSHAVLVPLPYKATRGQPPPPPSSVTILDASLTAAVASVRMGLVVTLHGKLHVVIVVVLR